MRRSVKALCKELAEAAAVNASHDQESNSNQYSAAALHALAILTISCFAYLALIAISYAASLRAARPTAALHFQPLHKQASAFSLYLGPQYLCKHPPVLIHFQAHIITESEKAHH
jgi:hypothetical protein